MRDLQSALTNLGFLEFGSVPSGNELGTFITDALQNAEFIANTVPIGADQHTSDVKHAATPSVASDEEGNNKPKGASSASKASETMHTSSTSLPLVPLRSRNEEFYKMWGKPLKLNAKENPLEVSVYKMAAQDKKGAWFARRSVHEGVGFTRFRRSMQREFLTSLAVKEGPGSGAVRGIAADKRLDKRTAEGVGKIEVWQLSARFGPVTPREFCILTTSSTNALTEASAPENAPTEIPRHFVTLSRPCEHPDAEARPGLVHGSYESVEMIREIAGSGDGTDPESNLVEWIMITRSDPGGGIPRFMVERGTPGSIVADVSKFLNWACNKEDIPSGDENEEETEIQRIQSEHKDSLAPEPDADEKKHQERNERAASVIDPGTAPTHDPTGSWFSTIGHAVESAVSGVIPYLPYGKMTHDENLESDGEEDDDDDNDTASTNSFASAEQDRASRHNHISIESPSSESLRREGDLSQLKANNKTDPELIKLQRKRAQLDERIAEARDKEAKAAKSVEDLHASERAKQAEKHSKELKKSEEKYKREVEKLEQRREKEARKAEERRVKALDKDRFARLTKERKDFKDKCDMLGHENDVLRETLEKLQKENTAFVVALGEMNGGLEIVKKIQKGGRVRAHTASSGSSSATSSLRQNAQGSSSLDIASSAARVETPSPARASTMPAVEAEGKAEAAK